MEEKKPVKVSVMAYVLGAIVLSGVVVEALVLFTVEDPVMRMRLGLLCVVWIAGPFAMAGRHPFNLSIGDPERAENRRFLLLRRRMDEFLREMKRLNWLVLDASRDSRAAESRRDEIGMVQADLQELMGEILDAAGRPGAKTDAEGPFKPRSKRTFPDIWDDAPGSGIDLEPEQDEEEENPPA